MLTAQHSKILRHAEALIIATHVIANDSEAICSVNGKHKGRCFGASNLFKRLLRKAKSLQLHSPRTRSDVEEKTRKILRHSVAPSIEKVRCVTRTDLNDNLGCSASQIEHSPLTLFSNIRRVLLTLKTSLSRKGRGSSPLSSQCTSLRTTVKQSKQRLLRSVSFMQVQKQTTRSDVKGVKPSQNTSLRAKRSNPRNNLFFLGLPRCSCLAPVLDYRQFGKAWFPSQGRVSLRSLLPKSARNDIKRGGFFSPFTYRLLARQAFTLAEILIVIGTIGIIASLTIPSLLQSYQEQQMVTGLQKFYSNLEQAVRSWKQDIGCDSPAVTCISQSNIIVDNTVSMDPLTKFMNVSKVIPFGSSTANWLPAQTFDYYGNNQTGGWGGCSNASTGPAKYLLSDGTTFCVDVNPTEFVITADVNGKKAPNRMGKDTFMFVIGFKAPRDIWPYPYATNFASADSLGLCGVVSTCDPTNTDPTVSNGASPTAYVLLNHRLPDFKALSQTVSGFRP